LIREQLQTEINTIQEKDEVEKIRQKLNINKPEQTESRNEIERKVGEAINFLTGRLDYPFQYDQRFNELSDFEFRKFADELAEVARSWRANKHRLDKKREYVEQVNSLINKYRPKKLNM